MDLAISAAFNPITLYGTYMRLLYCCNYFALYASFLPSSFYLIFYILFPFLAKSGVQAGKPAQGRPGWPRVAVGP